MELQMTPLSTKLVPIATLNADPENPRKHDDRNLRAIKESLQEHGQVEPLLVQRSTRMVIAGNGRLLAMKSLGWDEANVVLLDVDDTKARKLSIQMNRSGELATWDEEVLSKHLSELDSLGDQDLTLMGFSDVELEQLVAAYAETTEASQPPEVPTETPEPAAATPVVEIVDDDEQPTTVPAPMPASDTKEVHLYLRPDQLEPWQLAVRKLANQHGTDNTTDTVFKVITDAAADL